jgi:ribose transport system substrate-binding protein
VQGRISGAFEAIKSALPELPVECFVRIDGRGMRDKSKKAIADFLDRHPKDRRVLIAAVTDTSALGAVDAAVEKKRDKHVAIVGQDCIDEAIEQIKKKTSPLIASVSHETSSYGPSLMSLGLALLRGQTVPPYNYVSHRLVTRAMLADEQGTGNREQGTGTRK